MRGKIVVPISFAVFLVALPASAQDSADELGKVGDALLLYLVLAVLFEAALAPLFDWRTFIKNFEAKGVKTPIKFFLALGLVGFYQDLNVFSDVILIFKDGAPANEFVTSILTALLIAGGSSGVYEVFKKLGIRNPTERSDKAIEENTRALIQGSRDLQEEVKGRIQSNPDPLKDPAILPILTANALLLDQLDDQMKPSKP